jgi:hypothetical protein
MDLVSILDADIEPLFWTPKLLDKRSAWWGHVPFAFWLTVACKPRVFVELGTHHGVSYAAFCEAILRSRLAARSYAIDTWQGDEQTGFYGEDVYAALRAFNDANYAAFSDLIRSNFDDANSHFADEAIDLLHIDGYHTYEVVRHDFELWRPKLSARGVVLLHNTNVRSPGFGVWRLFEELSRTTPSFQFLHGAGLGVLALGSDAPEAIMQLCRLDRDRDIATVRERFSNLGLIWIDANDFRRDRERRLVRIQELEHTASDRAQQLVRMAEQVQKSKRATDRIHALERTAAEHKRTLDARQRDLEAHKRIVEPLGNAIDQAEKLIAYVSERYANAVRKRGVRALPRRVRLALSKSRVRRELYEHISSSVFFDKRFYLDSNPDLLAAGVDPIVHYLQFGAREGRNPSPFFAETGYRGRNPDVAAANISAIEHYESHGRAEGRRLLAVDCSVQLLATAGASRGVTAINAAEATPTARSMIQAHSVDWAPLPVFADRLAPPTVTILTDGVYPDHLFGGVGTSLVVGAMAARQMGARLRLATRRVAPDPAVLGQVLKTHRIEWEGASDFVQIPVGGDRPLALGAGDVLLTTSWWGTRAALGSVERSRILYLLQEDERTFYPFGDERLRCAETLSEPGLRILVNTKMLFDYLAHGPDPLPQLRQRGDWFEPAFPAIPKPDLEGAPRAGKANFFFYATPSNQRSLFWRGLEIIDLAMRTGVLPPEEWTIHFVGWDLASIELPGSVRPILADRLPWLEYSELISRMDLGLCLMYTPHPSYPPLDLAAAGAVVVTNTHGHKTALEEWSRNIIAAPPTVPALLEALRQGVALCRNRELRSVNWRSSNIPRDWEPKLRPVLERILPKGT